MDEKAFSGNGGTVHLPLPVAKAIAESPVALSAFGSLSNSDMEAVLREARHALSHGEIEKIVKTLEGM